MIPKRILVSGGRAPVALEWVRILGKEGHIVYVGDSGHFFLSQVSRYVEKTFSWPSPRWHYSDFCHCFKKILEEHKIDWVIPTCEEIFYLGQLFQDKLSAQFFGERLCVLLRLHHKYNFIDELNKQGFLTPDTQILNSREDLERTFSLKESLIYKPVFSRFGNYTLICPALKELQKISPTPKFPWVAQEYIAGPVFSTFSIAHEGKLLYHVDYPIEFTVGKASILFENTENQAIRDWVSQVTRYYNFSGQIGFDLVCRENQVIPLECNPRATSGLHLLGNELTFSSVLEKIPCSLNSKSKNSKSKSKQSKSIKLALFFYGGLGVLRGKYSWKKWKKSLWNSKDIIFSWDDLRPFIYQVGLAIYYFVKIIYLRKSIMDLTVDDIAWNNEN